MYNIPGPGDVLEPLPGYIKNQVPQSPLPKQSTPETEPQKEESKIPASGPAQQPIPPAEVEKKTPEAQALREISEKLLQDAMRGGRVPLSKTLTSPPGPPDKDIPKDISKMPPGKEREIVMSVFASQEMATKAAYGAAAESLKIENWAKEHNLTFEQALSDLSTKLNIPQDELRQHINDQTLVNYYMQEHGLGETNAILELSRKTGLNLSELNKLIKDRDLIGGYAKQHHMTIDQAWQAMAQELDLPVNKVQELVTKYQQNPSAATWMTFPVEVRQRIAGAAGVLYSPSEEYKKYLAENYFAVGTNISPGNWQHQVVEEYADKHNMTWQQAHILVNKMRDNPDTKELKYLSDAYRDDLADVAQRLALGKDYISKQDFARLRDSDKGLADVLIKSGYQAYEKAVESKERGSLENWTGKLKTSDPEGFKVFTGAGGGDAGVDAFNNFAQEREKFVSRYTETEKIDFIDGMAAKQYVLSHGGKLPEGMRLLMNGNVVRENVDVLKIVSDVNNKKLGLNDAVRYFGADIRDIVRQINDEYEQSPDTGEWYDKKASQQLKNDDPELWTILMTKGPEAYETALNKLKAETGITKATLERDIQAAIIKAEAEAAAEPVMDVNQAAGAWQAYDNYTKAETALINAMDKIDKEHPGMPREELGKLYNALPEYETYNKAKDAMLSNRSLIDDVMAELFSPEFGTIPTLTFNKEQLGRMYEDNVKIELAIYTKDRAKLKQLYDSGAFYELYGENKEEAEKAYKNALGQVAMQEEIKKAVEAGNLGRLDQLNRLGAFSGDQESYSKLYNYVKEGGRDLAPITPADIQKVKESLGTKQEFVEETAKQYPSGGEMAQEMIISMIPIVGTIRNWDKMDAGWKAASIITDALIMLPFATAAARAARAAKGVETGISLGERLKATGIALGKETWAQVRAPVDVIIHPVQSAKGVGRTVRDIAAVFDPENIGEFVSTLSKRVIRIEIGPNTTAQEALRYARQIVDEAKIKGSRIIIEGGAVRIEVPRGALMRELGGGLATASPDIKELLESRIVKFKGGLPAEEQGLFFATEPPLEFTSGSAFGGKIIPIANQATETVWDVGKYRVSELVRIDKTPVRSLDFANIKNVPSDYARAVQKYTRQNNGILSGSLNQYTKLKKSPIPNDGDLIFKNQAKSLDDILQIGTKLGYKVRRAEHSVEIFKDGEWIKAFDIDSIAHHVSTMPSGLSQRYLTRIDGILTETMGEQYLRQSYGAVEKTTKAATRAEVINKIAPEVKKMLKKASAEKRVPGVFIPSKKALLKKAVPTEKLWAKSAELENKYRVGADIVEPGAKIQHLNVRVGPLRDRADFYIEYTLNKPLSLRQIAKLKALEFVEIVKSPFTGPIKITEREGAVVASTSQLKHDLNAMESIIRQSGNVRQADEIARIIRIETQARKAPAILARAGMAASTAAAGQLASRRPAMADEIDDAIEKINEAELSGNRKEADRLLSELEGNIARPVRVPVSRDVLLLPEVRKAINERRPIDDELIDIVTERLPELRNAARQGRDTRVEATRLILEASREVREPTPVRESPSRVSRLTPARAPVTPPRSPRAEQVRAEQSLRVQAKRLPKIRIPRESRSPTERVPRETKLRPTREILERLKRETIPERFRTTPKPLRTGRLPRKERGTTKIPTGKKARRTSGEEEKKEWTPEEIKSAVAWKDGFVVHAIKSPYRRGVDERTFNINNLPVGLTVMPEYKGPGSQQKSARVTGRFPAKLSVDVGNQDVVISRARGGRVKLRHFRDTTGTVSRTTIKHLGRNMSKKRGRLYYTNIGGSPVISHKPIKGY